MKKMVKRRKQMIKNRRTVQKTKNKKQLKQLELESQDKDVPNGRKKISKLQEERKLNNKISLK